AKQPFRHRPLVVWTRGGLFDRIPKSDAPFVKKLVEKFKFETKLVEIESYEARITQLMNEAPEPEQDHVQNMLVEGFVQLEALLQCEKRGCALCAIIDEGLTISEDWPRHLKKALLMDWNALIAYHDMRYNRVEGWASEDVPLLILSGLLGGLLTLGLLYAVVLPDPEGNRWFTSNLKQMIALSWGLSFVFVLLVGREALFMCDGSQLERELERDDIGFFHPTGKVLFEGVTVFDMKGLRHEKLLEFLAQFMQLQLGLAKFDDLSIRDKSMADLLMDFQLCKRADVRFQMREIFEALGKRVLMIRK
ncbi:MAG TPA: hypothetical protein VEF04_17230, partial [Blastocatellia bacterium]|nr:hypothetical protein [Blastocatellia bacterium]